MLLFRQRRKVMSVKLNNEKVSNQWFRSQHIELNQKDSINLSEQTSIQTNKKTVTLNSSTPFSRFRFLIKRIQQQPKIRFFTNMMIAIFGSQKKQEFQIRQLELEINALDQKISRKDWVLSENLNSKPTIHADQSLFEQPQEYSSLIDNSDIKMRYFGHDISSENTKKRQLTACIKY